MLACAALLACLTAGCASTRNRSGGGGGTDPLLGPYRLEQVRSIPPANTVSANSSTTPTAPGIPPLTFSSGNAQLIAKADPLKGESSLAIDRQVPAAQQDAWQGSNGRPNPNQPPSVTPLPREEQPPPPQIVPANPGQRAGTVSWQGPIAAAPNVTPEAYAEYAQSLQKNAAAQAEQMKNGVQQLQNNATGQVAQVQQNLSADAAHLKATADATQAQFQQNLGHAHDAVKNAAANDWAHVQNTAQHVNDNLSAEMRQAADTLQAQLHSRGVQRLTRQSVPEGVKVMCILPRRDNPSSTRVYEATATDYPAALRAVLQQIDQGG